MVLSSRYVILVDDLCFIKDVNGGILLGGEKSVKLEKTVGSVPFVYINLFLYLCEAMRSVLHAFITKNKLD